MPMIFFGFTQCPAVCPTALARVAQIRKQLRGRDLELFQPVLITLDPERDTPKCSMPTSRHSTRRSSP
jgi:protein SCO1/2